MDTVTAALYWLDRGVELLPCKRGSKSLLPGFGPYKRHITEDDQAWLYFKKYNSNLALVCGTGSSGPGGHGLVVVDFDESAMYDRFIERYRKETYTVETARGYHCYFWSEDLTSWRGPGFEVKGEYSVILAATSTHPTGKVYKALDWSRMVQNGRPADLPLLSDYAPKNDYNPLGARSYITRGIKKDLIERIKAFYPIGEIASKLTLLRPSDKTGRYMVGRCPWADLHTNYDKHPSFWLDQERGIFGCHACGQRGDVINLYAKLKGIEINQAIKELAEGLK